jgi:GntR family transcriptional regulator
MLSDFRLDRSSHLPVYAQLGAQIKFLILQGELKPGGRLPTARQLAGFLRINRNTVLRAFQELEREGLIECRRGKGCVVVEVPGALAGSVSAKLVAVVDTAVEQARALGVDADTFAAFAYARARQRFRRAAKPRLVFVECETVIAAAVARAMQDRLGVKVTPVVLADLRRPTARIEAQLREADMVTTTFFHIQEVRRLLPRKGREVVALVVKPHLDKLIKLSEIPPGTKTALVCMSETCALDMQRSLEHAGITGLETSPCGVDDHEKLSERLAGQSVVIASDFVADEVRPLVRPDQEFIELGFTVLDEGAVSFLKSVLTEEPQAV